MMIGLASNIIAIEVAKSVARFGLHLDGRARSRRFRWCWVESALVFVELVIINGVGIEVADGDLVRRAAPRCFEVADGDSIRHPPRTAKTFLPVSTFVFGRAGPHQ